MKKIILITGFSLLMGLQFNAVANDGFISEQGSDTTAPPTLTPAEAEAKRQKIQTMAKDTLARLYKEEPKAEEKIKNAYGYGVFEGHIANILLYVAGKGTGVVYDNKTQTPVFMTAVRAGTGPGVGYKSSHYILIFDNEIVYKQFTTIGLQASASGDAVIKVKGKEAGGAKAASLVPGV